MKFSFGSSKSKSKEKQTILFVCVQNAGRSQMAETFFRKYAPEDYEPLSAGTKPTSEIKLTLLADHPISNLITNTIYDTSPAN